MMNYYAESALTSNDLPRAGATPFEEMDLGDGNRGIDLLAFPDCDEYLASTITDSPQRQSHRLETKEYQLDQQKYVFELFNLKSFCGDIAWGFSLLFFVFLIPLPFYLLLTKGLYNAVNLFKICPFIVEFMAYAFCARKLFQYFNNRGEAENKLILNRQNGSLELNSLTGHSLTSFRDHRPLISCQYGYAGQISASLRLLNTQTSIAIPLGGNSAIDAIIRWNFFKQYMDSSRPLPDVPELESVRHLDPTTREYDKKTGRDPYYWRKKSTEELKQLCHEAEARVRKKFPDFEFYR